MFSALDAAPRLPNKTMAAAVADNQNRRMGALLPRSFVRDKSLPVQSFERDGTHAADTVALTLPTALRWATSGQNDRGNAP
jgi:hypothetical protein